MLKQITTEQFQMEVTESKLLSLVKFKTKWSGASQIIEPLYNELSRVYQGTVNFFIVDTEQDSPLADRFGIMELPTILIFKKGKVIDHVSGLTSKNHLITKIETALTADS